jgi:hypothetical protein
MDPLSLAILGVSTGLKMFGSIFAGNTEAAQAEANAALFEAQARARMAKARFDADKSRRDYERHAGKVQASIGKSGVDARNFSDIMADDAMEGALERAAIMWSGRTEADFLRYQGQVQQFNASAARTSGYIGAATAFVNGISSFRTASSAGGSGISLSSNFSSPLK